MGLRAVSLRGRAAIVGRARVWFRRVGVADKKRGTEALVSVGMHETGTVCEGSERKHR